MHRVSVHRSAHPIHSSRGGLSGAVVFEPTLPKSRELRFGALAGSFSTRAAFAGATEAYGSHESAGPTGATSIALRREGAKNDFSYESDGGTSFRADDDETVVRENADSLTDDVWVVSRARLPMGSQAARLSLVVNGFRREKGVSSLALIPALASREEVKRLLAGISTVVGCGESCEWNASSNVSFTGLETRDPELELRLGSERVRQNSSRFTHQWGVSVWPTETLETQLSLVYESSRMEKDLGLDLERRPAARGVEALGAGVFSAALDVSDAVYLRGEARASCMRAVGQEDIGADGNDTTTWKQCAPELRAGGTFRATESLSLRSTLVRGIRFPTLGERFGVSATTRGNPNLRVEKAWSADAGANLEKRLSKSAYLTGELSAFYRHASDVVAYRRAAQGYVRPYNITDARFVGGEGASSLTAWDHLRLGTGLSLLRARDVSGGRESHVPFRSALTWLAELEVFSEREDATFSYLGAGATMNYRSGRVADPAGLLVIPEQWILDLSARVEVKPFQLKTRLSNLFDQARFDTIGFPLPGRAFFVSAEIVVP